MKTYNTYVGYLMGFVGLWVHEVTGTADFGYKLSQTRKTNLVVLLYEYMLPRCYCSHLVKRLICLCYHMFVLVWRVFGDVFR